MCIRDSYKTPACDHEIPQQNAERTFELLLHGTPYADCLIAEDENGQMCIRDRPAAVRVPRSAGAEKEPHG